MPDPGGLAIGGAAFGAGTSLIGTVAQNENIRKAGSANADATRLQYGQIDEAAALEVRKRAAQTQLARGRLRVLAGDSGLGFDGSFSALEDQQIRNDRIDTAIIDRNAYDAKVNAASQLKASLIRLFSGTGNPILSGLQGGISGFSTGLRIGEYANGVPPDTTGLTANGELPPNPADYNPVRYSGYPGETGQNTGYA